jgi:Peptidase family S41
MSPVLSALPIAAAVLLSAVPAPPPREIEDVAAFARLYGVVRFFYPSDAAADIDWNRFAVLGVARVRAARDAGELEATLRQLVAPLGPGIEIGASLPPAAAAAAPGEPLVAWRYVGPGFSTMGGAYRAKRTHRPATPSASGGFVTLMQSVPAANLRGKAIRLTAQARATASDPASGGALWLRVDRPNQRMGFFDNMGNRPIREPAWRPYAIEGTVADDAENVAFGVMAVGAVTADFDAVELAVKDAAGNWAPVAIQDAGFEAADAEKSGWFKTGPADAAISRPTGAPQGGQYVRFAPPPPGPPDVELFPEGAPTPGAHVDLDLGSGLRARVPLALTDAEARPDPGRRADLDTLHGALAGLPGPAASPDLDQRLADIVVAWSVLRHFYPYWTEAGVDWDARLQPQLEIARAADTREAQRDALRSLVADARDGHGSVSDTLDKTQRAELPVRLAVVEGRLVVVSSARPSEVPVGAVVATIDGAPATDRLARALSLVSGTTQWRQVSGVWPITVGPTGTTVRLGLDTGSGTRDVELTYGTPPPPVTRPEPVVEKEPGVWYVDLTRATMAEIDPKLAAIAAARAVVFDVRGYPTDAGFGILPHLLDAPETDRWMHVAKIDGPLYETAGWNDFGWDVKPASPRIAGRVVFLTDGGAISYAESVMGYVGDRKLGTIVGGPTAGTNGNVASFVTPGGFSVNFTGMRVTRHDGRSPHHLVGVKPDVPVAPTLEGLRAGRDEVLERGLEVARARATP